MVEAILVGLLLASAIFFAVAFQGPAPPSATHGTQELEQVTWDAVRSLSDMYYHDPAFGNSSLSRAVADAMAGDATKLTATLDQFFPPGTAYNVYLHNGFDRIPVHESREPTGQTIGISFPFEPRWNYVFTSPDLSVYDSATSTTMGVTLIPLHNSNLVRDQGYGLAFEIVGDQNWVPGGSVGTAQFNETTYAQLVTGSPTGGGPTAAASVFFECERSLLPAPCFAVDLSGSTAGYESTVEDTLVFVVENAGPGPLEVGTSLELRIPVGLDPGTPNADPEWGAVETIGTAPHPVTLRFPLTSEISAGASSRIELPATITDTRYAFKTVDAVLSGRASSTSQLLVQVADKAAGTYTGGDTRQLLVSGPRPVSDGTAARWGAVMLLPFGDGEARILNMTVADGVAGLQSVTYPGDFNPPTDVTGGVISSVPAGWPAPKVAWMHSGESIEAYSFLEFQFMIEPSAALTEPSAPHLAAVAPNLRFEGYRPAPMLMQIEPGIYWREEPPAGAGLPGFGNSFFEADSVDRTLEGRLGFRNKLLSGSWEYQLADLADPAQSQAALKDALRAARIIPADEIARLGSTISVEIDTIDLANHLAGSVGINNFQLTTNVYAPWGIRDRIPNATHDHFAASGSLARPNDLEVAFLNADVYPDIVVSYSDGNVYGIDGQTGRTFQNRIFQLPPTVNPADPIEPTLLAKGRRTDTGEPMYGVGTTKALGLIYHIDDELDFVEDADKGELGATLGINATTDFSGDGVPEVFVSNRATTTPGSNAAGYSRLELYDGSTMTLYHPGWDFDESTVSVPPQPDEVGVVVTGTASELGMGKVGPHAANGVYVNTGMEASLGVRNTIEASAQDFLDDPSEEGIWEISESIDFSVGVYDSGLQGFYTDGRQAWNMTGGRFVRLANVDAVDTGGAWTGFAGGGGDGWVYGFSGKKAITPVTGFELLGATGFTDLSMSNELEGYAVSPIGYLAATRDGWSTYAPFKQKVADLPGGKKLGSVFTYPGTQGVSTVAEDPYGAGGKISWWVGDAGILLRSTDRLTTVEEITATPQLQGIVSTTPGGPLVPAFGNLQDLDSNLIDWNDVHAVSADEAWFVGGGVNGTSYAPYGYIGRTADGGSTILVTQYACRDALLFLLTSCHFHGIDSDGESLYVVGEYGTVLKQKVDGVASEVHFLSGTSIDSEGRVEFTLDADTVARAKAIQVSWNNTDFSWMKQVKANGSTIWRISDGAAHVSGTILAGVGASSGSSIDLDGYDLLKGDLDANQFGRGNVLFELGPFKDSTNPPLGYFSEGANPALPQPVSFFVTITYQDGTQDLYILGLGTGRNSFEATSGNWAPVTEPGVTCMGAPDPACTRYLGVDVGRDPITGDLLGAIAGRAQPSPFQSSIVFYDNVDARWEMRASPVATTLRDVAFNVDDPARWLAVGNNDRVLASYDRGETWTDLPKIYDASSGGAAQLNAVEFTHPEVGYVMGGTGSGLWWTVDGYTEYGQLVTSDLWTGGTINSLGLDWGELLVSQVGGGAGTVAIDVRDPDGSWLALHRAEAGWVKPGTGLPARTTNVTFSSATDEVVLRFTLHTPAHGFSRFSPQVRGEFDLAGWTDTDVDWTDLDEGPFTTNLTALPVASGGDTLDLVTTPGVLRLKAVHNPWVYKLPSDRFGKFASDRHGARTGDMDLSPDGTRLYVGTEGLYEMGAAFTEAPVGWDNTLYAVDPATGTPVSGWTKLRFPETGTAQPIQFVQAYDDGLWVVTQNITAGVGGPGYEPLLHQVIFDDPNPPSIMTYYALDPTAEVVDLEIGFFTGGPRPDAVLGIKLPSGEGSVEMVLTDAVAGFWTAHPSIHGLFAFEFKVPLSAMYGAYLIETEVEWDITGDFLGGGSLLQTARLYNAFTVTPPNERIPASPTYNLEVVAWMEDWG